jgi:hypothetical protein
MKMYLGKTYDLARMPYSISSFKLKGFLLALVLFIAWSMQPLSMVDEPDFRDLIHHIDP